MIKERKDKNCPIFPNVSTYEIWTAAIVLRARLIFFPSPIFSATINQITYTTQQSEYIPPC